MHRVTAAVWWLSLVSSSIAGSVLNKRAALDECLQSSVVPADEPGSEDWELDISPYNARLKYEPLAIAAPTSIEHIQAAVSCAAKLGVKASPKCGGHSYASLGLGGEDGHLVIQMDRMHNVTLDKETGIAKIQGGTRLGHVASELFAQGGRAISHGTCPGVGVSGHALHGGFGMSSHTKGLALDWIVGATVVLANSSVVHVSETENPDLFWAMRGAGSNFGVVAEYEFKTFEPPANVTWFAAALPWKNTTAVAGLEALEHYAREQMPAELNMRLFASSYFSQLEGLYYGDVAGLKLALEPLLNVTGGSIQQAQSVGWLDALAHYGNGKLDQTRPYEMQETIYARGVMLKGLNGKAAQSFVDYWFNTAKEMPSSRIWYFQLDLHAGNNSAIFKNRDAMSSYAHRDKLYMMQFYDRVTRGAYPTDGFSFLDGWVANMTASMPTEDWGLYINYQADATLDRTLAQEVYYGANLPRLQQIKTAVDPSELFYYPQSVRPFKPSVP